MKGSPRGRPSPRGIRHLMASMLGAIVAGVAVRVVADLVEWHPGFNIALYFMTVIFLIYWGWRFAFIWPRHEGRREP